MVWRILAVLASASLLAGPALAQAPNPAPAASSPAAPLPPAASPSSPVAEAMSGLLAEGYEIRAVTVLSDPIRGEIYRDPKVPPQVMVTLQKGASVAVCMAALVNWMNQAVATRDNNALCHRD